MTTKTQWVVMVCRGGDQWVALGRPYDTERAAKEAAAYAGKQGATCRVERVRNDE